METKNIWTFIIVGIFSFLIGIIVSVIIQNWVPISIDGKIRYFEILNWLTTIVIGIIIGYYLKNKYENNKIIKQYLLDDLENIFFQLRDVNKYCDDLKNFTCFTEEQRKEMNAKVNILDKKITIFLDLLEDCNKEMHSNTSKCLIDSLNSLNRKMTNDSLYSDNIQKEYFDEITAERTKFEKNLRKVMLNIVRTM
ncbi:hypothetical protein CAPN004_05750 [Capnocytophaga cynodegmi]|uniref:hypothetical protein n=1 Tax=Capnocytophaga cynodegmi TaxID=28189 RepID=UPI001AC22F55|nr:hypothetical protein [Capnocytophaga cynodegmi]GIM51545.1 hypothetical protein CAPN004_05750 [Capnocytophaga cynodegmi]